MTLRTSNPTLHHPTPAGLIEALVAVTGVDMHRLCTRGREPDVVLARAVVCAAARSSTYLSYAEIAARILNRGSHSVVMGACARFERMRNRPVYLSSAPLSVRGWTPEQMRDAVVRIARGHPAREVLAGVPVNRRAV